MTDKIGLSRRGMGTALAMLLADNGHDVTLWMYEKDLAEETRAQGKTAFISRRCPARSIRVTSLLEEAVQDKTIVLSVVPPILSGP